MKNWLKNLLFVIFSFVFLGVGMLVANIFIREKGNPLKDPNFLADPPADTTSSFPIDSTQGWMGDTVQIDDKFLKKEKLTEQAKPSNTKMTVVGDYDVIIGIFGEKANADRQIKKLKELGYQNAYSYSKESMKVVSAGQFSENEAKEIKPKLENQGFDTILKRR
jgi:ribosomal protein L7/L12